MACESESVCSSAWATGFAIDPLDTVIVTSKLQGRLVLLVSHVHQTFQWPPDVYCVKTPTPSPGVAFIVRFGSTSTSIGCPAVPPLLLPDEPDELPPYAYPPAPLAVVASTEHPRSSAAATVTPRAPVLAIVQARHMPSSHVAPEWGRSPRRSKPGRRSTTRIAAMYER